MMVSLSSLIRSLFLVFILTIYLAYAEHISINAEEHKHNLLFEKFIKKHQRQYSNHSEKAHRFMVFKKNMRQIDELNKLHNSTTLFGITNFADWTQEEFKNLFLDNRFAEIPPDMEKYNPPAGGFVGANSKKAVNYVKYMTPVKNQGSCGSCWSFAAVALTEYLYKKKTGKNHDFSEQAVLDCDSTSFGCDGGYVASALNLIKKNGVPLDRKYRRYQGYKGVCNYTVKPNKIKSTAFITAGFSSISSYLANVGAFVGMVQIDQGAQYYKKGIYRPSKESCERHYGWHFWVVAGIDYDNNRPYYIIKNSWGTSWGEKGYIRFGAGNNACGTEVYSYGASL